MDTITHTPQKFEDFYRIVIFHLIIGQGQSTLSIRSQSRAESYLWHITHCRWFNIIYTTRLLRTHTYTIEHLNFTLFHVSVKRLSLHVWCHIPLIGRELLYNYLCQKRWRMPMWCGCLHARSLVEKFSETVGFFRTNLWALGTITHKAFWLVEKNRHRALCARGQLRCLLVLRVGQLRYRIKI